MPVPVSRQQPPSELRARRSTPERPSSFRPKAALGFGLLALYGIVLFLKSFGPDGSFSDPDPLPDQLIVAVQGTNYLSEPVIDPANRTVASLAQDGTVSFWSLSSGELDYTVRVPGLDLRSTTLTTLSADSRYLAVADPEVRSTGLVIHDLVDPAADVTVDQPGPLHELAFLGTGEFLVAVTTDRLITVWDLSTGEPIGDPIQAAEGPWALNDEGTLLVYLNADGQVLSQDPTGPEDEGSPVPFSDHPRRLAVDGDASLLIGTEPNQRFSGWWNLTALDLRDDTAVPEEVDDIADPTAALALSPDGRLAAIAGSQGSVMLCDLGRPGSLHDYLFIPWDAENTDQEIVSLRFTPDGTSLAGRLADGQIALWHNLPPLTS